MKIKNKLKAIDIKTFIIPLIIIVGIFFIVGYSTITIIKNYYYNDLKEESLIFAKSYSQSMMKATEAQRIVNKLLEEKLLAASKMTALYEGRYSNELLKELALNLDVDEILIHNAQGELVYSDTGEFIGWKAYEGHPVYDFRESGEESLVEDIRQNTESGIYHKYGYFKASNGFLVQIGVLAEEIQEFLGGFEMQQLLDEMQENGMVMSSSFINNNLTIISSTDEGLVGKEIRNQETKAAIIEDKEYGFINNENNGENSYEVFVPIYLQDSKIGTLGIGRSVENTEKVVRRVTIIGILSLLFLFLVVLHMIISVYKKNNKLINLAFYDPLTGLPNKQFLEEFLREEIHRKEENKKAIFLINCNDFKTINLTFGFQYGDKILQELGEKLRGLSNSYEMLFRFTDDGFLLYVQNYEDKEDLITLVHKINKVFDNPFKNKEGNQFISGKIGIVEMENKYDSVDPLLKDVSISLTHIRNNGSINYAFFNQEMENKLQREEMIERELRTAIVEKYEKKFYVEYQPLVDLKTNQIVGFEALSRMKSDHFGLISPKEFIDIAERKQLIVPLGKMILKTAFRFAARMNRIAIQDLRMSVNISGIQLLREDFTETIGDIIKETGIKGLNLVLEITESILLDNFKVINEKLKELQGQGIQIALDDFGTGYSSFWRIKELNIDCVKIDKSFISKILTKNHKNLLTQDIISMSHKLGHRVVAEGVETQAQKEYLIESNCDIMQGYLFSTSLSEEDAIEMLKANIWIESPI